MLTAHASTGETIDGLFDRPALGIIDGLLVAALGDSDTPMDGTKVMGTGGSVGDDEGEFEGAPLGVCEGG